jgi:hypothetical protein
LVHGQISSRNRAFAAIVDAESLGEAMGRLLAAGIGPEDVGSPPAEATEF